MRDELRRQNKELHYGLDLIHKGVHKECLFESHCMEPTISAHSVSRTILNSIQLEGQVIAPNTRNSKDESGRSQIDLRFMVQAVSRASTGTFACQGHDRLFDLIDHTPMDFDDPRVLNLLYYRAILREAWLLQKIRLGMLYAESKGPLPTPLSLHPDTRLKALLDSIARIRPHLDDRDCPLTHIVRRVKSARPILAASCAGASAVFLNGFSQPVSWTFSVLPQDREHVAVASFLKDSIAESYFKHFRKADGRELQAVISAELIYFGENWFLHPKVWEAYGETKRTAITQAYNNVEELILGNYTWWDRDEKTPWHKYMNVANRHQLNLFRYDKSVFAVPSS